MKSGTLFYDKNSGWYNFNYREEDGDIRDYGGIHCGEVFEFKLNDVWVPARMQMVEDWYPVISDETWELLVPGEDGKYFHHKREYFVRLFRIIIGDKEFTCHELRKLAIDTGKIKIG